MVTKLGFMAQRSPRMIFSCSLAFTAGSTGVSFHPPAGLPEEKKIGPETVGHFLDKGISFYRLLLIFQQRRIIGGQRENPLAHLVVEFPGIGGVPGGIERFEQAEETGVITLDQTPDLPIAVVGVRSAVLGKIGAVVGAIVKNDQLGRRSGFR